MTGFDDLVAHAKKQRDANHAAAEFQRDQAQKEADRAVAEVSETGRNAAEHLRDGQVPAIPIIEFGTSLLGRPKIAETGRAWQLSAGLLTLDGTFLDNPVVAAGDAANEGPPDNAHRRLHALSMTGGGRDEGSIAVAELIARDVAALLGTNS